MVTRLQSAKGSFVQSPKGAFDGEAVIVPPDIRLQVTLIVAGVDWFGPGSTPPGTSPCTMGTGVTTGAVGGSLFFKCEKLHSSGLFWENAVYADISQFEGLSFTGETSGQVQSCGPDIIGNFYCNDGSENKVFIPAIDSSRSQFRDLGGGLEYLVCQEVDVPKPFTTNEYLYP